MTDAFKIIAKTALIAVITAAVFALFANIQIPDLDTSLISEALGIGMAVAFHWIPILNVVWPIVVFLLGFELAKKAFDLAMIAVRWVFKVNE